MQMMAVDPLQRIVAPRFIGGVIAMPLLVAIFNLVGLFGAQLVGVQLMGVDVGAYWSQMQGAVQLNDVQEGFIKSVVFGTACSLVAVYEGYHTEPTAAGVGLATTRTVVTSSVLTLLLILLEIHIPLEGSTTCVPIAHSKSVPGSSFCSASPRSSSSRRSCRAAASESAANRGST